jgi:dTDP-4-amino-4,6-dideoxygalactose transaminase
LDEALSNLPGIGLQPVQPGVGQSEQYYPVVINAELFGRNRDAIYSALKDRGILSRKYFHPICTDFAPYRGFPIISTRNTPYVSEVKSQVLCLPFYSGVTDEDVEEIRAVFHGL